MFFLLKYLRKRWPHFMRYLDRMARRRADRRPPVLSAADRWAIGIGAIYGAIHQSTNERLPPHTRFRRRESLNMLASGWGVTGPARADRRRQTLDVMGWLATEGHRFSNHVEPGDTEAFADMLAWDIARAVMVARHAFTAGYVTEAEAWSHVRGAALAAQQNFPSWAEYGHRYLRGYRRWENNPRKQTERRNMIEALSRNPDSPWCRLDWQTPLTWPASAVLIKFK
jgi:hypothetical protein